MIHHRHRVISPETPSAAELVAAAAKLTQVQAELSWRKIFIGPPPPAVVAEAESANEAERFEEVTRILEVEADFPYDVLGVNHNISADNIKKRYWKLSILVHPDKCPHPLAHQAFIKLNKSLKELQDPDKFGMTMQSTIFSKSSKARRGDTSVWTDTPSERAQKAKMNYLEAYNEAAALASNEVEKKRKSSDADLVDKYNKEKRSKSLVQKHQEEATSRSKKKTKLQPEKEQWVGQHPWKPGDRNKDLGAGRKNIKLYSKNMAEGLTSRFSSGNVQRSFL